MPFKKFKPFRGVPAGHDDSTVGTSDAFFLDGFSPLDVGDMFPGVVKGCAADDMAEGWSPACRGLACPIVFVEMASAAFAGVVDIARRDDVKALALRASRRAHRRQIMVRYDRMQ